MRRGSDCIVKTWDCCGEVIDSGVPFAIKRIQYSADTEQSLKEVPIAPPVGKKAVLEMLRLANQIIEAKEPFALKQIADQENKINGIVIGLLGSPESL